MSKNSVTLADVGKAIEHVRNLPLAYPSVELHEGDNEHLAFFGHVARITGRLKGLTVSECVSAAAFLNFERAPSTAGGYRFPSASGFQRNGIFNGGTLAALHNHQCLNVNRSEATFDVLAKAIDYAPFLSAYNAGQNSPMRGPQYEAQDENGLGQTTSHRTWLAQVSPFKVWAMILLALLVLLVVSVPYFR